MSQTNINSQDDNASVFFSLVNNKNKFRLFLLQKLPAAFFSSISVTHINAESCTVTVPYKWFTQNPFRSTYFACLSMAAEMSTGVLAMAFLYRKKPGMSMLITASESKYHKKATGITTFFCGEGQRIQQTINDVITGNAAKEIRVYTKGVNKMNDLVAEFWFTWSFKLKTKTN